MSKVGNALNVPNFLTAPSREELVRLMLSNNLDKSTEHRYFDITFDGKVWVAWFYQNAEMREMIRVKKIPAGGKK